MSTGLLSKIPFDLIHVIFSVLLDDMPTMCAFASTSRALYEEAEFWKWRYVRIRTISPVSRVHRFRARLLNLTRRADRPGKIVELFIHITVLMPTLKESVVKGSLQTILRAASGLKVFHFQDTTGSLLSRSIVVHTKSCAFSLSTLALMAAVKWDDIKKVLDSQPGIRQLTLRHPITLDAGDTACLPHLNTLCVTHKTHLTFIQGRPISYLSVDSRWMFDGDSDWGLALLESSAPTLGLNIIILSEMYLTEYFRFHPFHEIAPNLRFLTIWWYDTPLMELDVAICDIIKSLNRLEILVWRSQYEPWDVESILPAWDCARYAGPQLRVVIHDNWDKDSGQAVVQYWQVRQAKGSMPEEIMKEEMKLWAPKPVWARFPLFSNVTEAENSLVGHSLFRSRFLAAKEHISTRNLEPCHTY
ncbi:hypothetical protein DL93DRAFT_917085 [Clavulina sp. PMI_390]|nr:hypothetical protein DL93DRAFT_917085 [Clavulina sp. PMI_390]